MQPSTSRLAQTSRILAILCLTLLAATPLLAQLRGRLVGKVVEPDGQPVPGVKVTLTSVGERPFTTSTKTDKQGKFVLTVVDATLPYEIHFQKKGYVKAEGPIELRASGIQRMTQTLPPLPKPGAAGGTSNKAAKSFNAAVKAYNAGDLDTARRKLETALKQNPKLEQAYGILGAIYFEQGDFQAAVETADRILAKDPESPEALRLKFDAQKEMGDLEGAEATLDRLAALGDARDANRAYNLGLALLREGQREAALRRLEQATTLNPELAAAYVGQAIALNNLERFEEAAAAAERAIQIEPGNLSAHTVRVEAYRNLGDETKLAAAQAALEEAAASGDPEELMRRGEALFNSGEIDKAIPVLERALAAQPDLADAHYFLGMAYVNQGQSASGAEHLKRFLELEPDSPDAAAARQMLEYLE